MSNPANMFVKFDREFYFGGELVTGNIMLNVSSPFPATAINLKIKGWECVKFVFLQYIHPKTNPNNPQAPPIPVVTPPHSTLHS